MLPRRFDAAAYLGALMLPQDACKSGSVWTMRGPIWDDASEVSYDSEPCDYGGVFLDRVVGVARYGWRCDRTSPTDYLGCLHDGGSLEFSFAVVPRGPRQGSKRVQNGLTRSRGSLWISPQSLSRWAHTQRFHESSVLSWGSHLGVIISLQGLS